MQLYQTTKVNTDVAGKKAESYMRGQAGFLLEVQSHAVVSRIVSFVGS